MDPLIEERDGAVATLSINDAPYNRMSLEFMDALEEKVERIGADDSVRSVVLTSQGLENFSVGMNLKQLPEGIERLGSADAVFDQRLRVIDAIENMGKPWIATLFGYCLGGGLELLLACHFRIAAAQGAKIGLPEMDLGTVPAWGGSARLPRVVGRDAAIDMILRGRMIDANEALRIGLVGEICPLGDLKKRVQELGDELAKQPRLAVKGMLDTLVGFETKTLQQSIEDERAAVHLTQGTPDAKEGMLAFLEKRDPKFNQGE